MSEATKAKLVQLVISVLATLLGLWADRTVQVQPPTIITKPAPVVPQAPPGIPQPGPVQPGPTQNPIEAIGRIQFGSAGCTATVIAPPRADGQYDCLTAAHCVRDVGAEGKMTLRTGKSFRIRVVAMDRGADWCWLRTVDAPAGLPVARLAAAHAAEGTPVWHAGFGVDKPGNVEEGTATRGPVGGQCEYYLSVSSGDSGGAIVNRATGEVLSPVCCTTRLSGKGRVFGACPEACTAGRRNLP